MNSININSIRMEHNRQYKEQYFDNRIISECIIFFFCVVICLCVSWFGRWLQGQVKSLKTCQNKAKKKHLTKDHTWMMVFENSSGVNFHYLFNWRVSKDQKVKKKKLNALMKF